MPNSDLDVTITVDAGPFEAGMRAFRKAINATAEQVPAFSAVPRRYRLDSQRHRIRVVTRRKQRRRW